MTLFIQSYREDSGEEVLEYKKHKLFTDVCLSKILYLPYFTLHYFTKFLFQSEIKTLLAKREYYFNLFITKGCPVSVIMNWIEYEKQFLKLLTIRRMNKGLYNLSFY